MEIDSVLNESHQAINYAVNGLLTIVFVIGWFWIRGVIVSQKEIEDKVNDLKTDLKVNTANDLNHETQFKEIKDWMIRIEKKIDDLRP